jgi:hypothetical protein
MADSNSSTSRIDPLSPATRATKRNLLIASLVGIAFKAFDITVQQIPLAGLSIKFDRGIFEFLLLAVLLYLLITFCLYYYIDIRNFPPTTHQLNTEKWNKLSLGFMIQEWAQNATPKVNHASEPPFRYTVCSEYQGCLDQLAGSTRSLFAALRKKKPLIDYTAMLVEQPVKSERIFGQKADAEKALANYTERFLISYCLRRWMLRPRLWTVRFAYAFRNYGTDGLLPIMAAVIALAALFHIIDVTFLAAVVPRT